MFTKRAEDCAQPQSPGSFASGSTRYLLGKPRAEWIANGQKTAGRIRNGWQYGWKSEHTLGGPRHWLVDMPAVRVDEHPFTVPTAAGVYLLSGPDRHLYATLRPPPDPGTAAAYRCAQRSIAPMAGDAVRLSVQPSSGCADQPGEGAVRAPSRGRFRRSRPVHAPATAAAAARSHPNRGSAGAVDAGVQDRSTLAVDALDRHATLSDGTLRPLAAINLLSSGFRSLFRLHAAQRGIGSHHRREVRGGLARVG